MAKKVYLSGKVEVKTTFSRVADPVDKAKVRARGPNLIGQLKDFATIRLGKIEREDLTKRVEAAKKILETGKVPAAAKGGSPVTKDATLAKAKGDLTKAKKKIEVLEKELEELKKSSADK